MIKFDYDKDKKKVIILTKDVTVGGSEEDEIIVEFQKIKKDASNKSKNTKAHKN